MCIPLDLERIWSDEMYVDEVYNTWRRDGGEGERLLYHAELGLAVVGVGRRVLAHVVEAVVNVVAQQALPRPRTLVV